MCKFDSVKIFLAFLQSHRFFEVKILRLIYFNRIGKTFLLLLSEMTCTAEYFSTQYFISIHLRPFHIWHCRGIYQENNIFPPTPTSLKKSLVMFLKFFTSRSCVFQFNQQNKNFLAPYISDMHFYLKNKNISNTIFHFWLISVFKWKP